MTRIMVIFLNGGNSYEQKELVFERQIDDCIGRAERESSPRGTLRKIPDKPIPVLQVA